MPLSRTLRNLAANLSASSSSSQPQNAHPNSHHAPPEYGNGYTPALAEQDKPPPYARPPEEQFLPPPGPPPGHAPHPPPPPSLSPPDYQPGPNESQQQQQHPWQSVVPDTALLPPPPSLGYEESPTSNAPKDEADRARDYCRRNPLYAPRWLSATERAAIEDRRICLCRNPPYIGELFTLPHNPSAWKARTWSGLRDACLHTDLPLYAARHDSPCHTGVAKTIYFEVRVHTLGGGGGVSGDISSLALGFCAKPYPSWRLPGWERASLGVHSDDGRRYVNDDKGGKDFTRPFQPGETLGIGMTFSSSSSPSSSASSPPTTTSTTTTTTMPMLNVNVFFTRNGHLDGAWDLHEELDADDAGAADGLDGRLDLYPAIGFFGGPIDLDVFFHDRDWIWRG